VPYIIINKTIKEQTKKGLIYNQEEEKTIQNNKLRKERVVKSTLIRWCFLVVKNYVKWSTS
jgi:hypothetical protein